MKDTYIKPEIRSENLDPEALSCAGSGGNFGGGSQAQYYFTAPFSFVCCSR